MQSLLHCSSAGSGFKITKFDIAEFYNIMGYCGIFRDCILLNFMQNLRFQIMPNSHNITALTHRVRDIFNKV